jgi:hypothetical protein
MPDFTWSRAVILNALDDRPLAAWKYRRLPQSPNGRWGISIMQRATAIGMLESIDAGAQNIKQRSNIHAGGTAGSTPIPQTSPVIQFVADDGDEIIIANDNTTAGTITVDGYINVEPI